MKTFRYIVFQDFKSYYKGYLEIEAESEEEAQKILDKKTKEEIEQDCFNWTQGDDTFTDGDIDIDFSSIHEVEI